MLIPTLETDRLRLIAPAARCEAAYVAFYTDASASQHYGGPLSAGQAWARLAADLGSWHLQGFGVWAIEFKPEGSIIGTCGFWQGHGWPRELTWWLLPSARGRGLALEASRAAVKHAYQIFAWPEVQTYMNDENAGARALAMRLGGQVVRRQRFPDGLERDIFHIPPPTAA
jgi:[ribosomal protein S5]-alanine N-acetyltransferase